MKSNPNIFANNPLDRASARRVDARWVAERLSDPVSLAAPLWRGQPFILPEAAPGQGRDVGWMRPDFIQSLQHADAATVVFLGLNRRGKALFAVDVSAEENLESAATFKGLGSFEDLRSLAMRADMPGAELAILAQAKALLEWHSRHRFCAVCGAPSQSTEAGYKRICTSCGAEHFPRTDPVVIMLATHGDRCLMGRQKTWPEGMYSALAGFVEPGESMEEAVARELREEAGIAVSAVHYHSTQPWPFPSTLMIGCLADAESEEFCVDGVEIEEARWFTRPDVADIMANRHGDGISIPPPMAIAHQLVRSFLASHPPL